MTQPLSRRTLLRAAGAAVFLLRKGEGRAAALPAGASDWNGTGLRLVRPEKAPLIQLADRPLLAETPRRYFLSAFTPNEAFFVRWHLPFHPDAVDLSTYRLSVSGHVARPLSLPLAELLARFPATTIAAVNQCAGNSRSRFSPRVPGVQWGNGAMGCARWTGVPLKDVLRAAGVQKGAVQVQFGGLDRGPGPEGKGSRRFQKSLAIEGDALSEALLCYAMNGEPLPLVNGFPLRLVVPGYFSTYWIKALSDIRVLSAPDENFWMKSAYLVPDNALGRTTPAEAAAGRLQRVPIGRMPVRSFLIAPDGNGKIPAGLPLLVRGIAFSGRGPVRKVEFSADEGKRWTAARLGEDHGRYAFRTFEAPFVPRQPGPLTLSVRAEDDTGDMQRDDPHWNPGGYLWNRIERQTLLIGPAS